MRRVRDSQTVDALFAARDERSAVQDMRRKCVCDCDMLLGVRVNIVDILPVTVGLREASSAVLLNSVMDWSRT
mgnify:CR=1 FL=1